MSDLVLALYIAFWVFVLIGGLIVLVGGLSDEW